MLNVFNRIHYGVDRFLTRVIVASDCVNEHIHDLHERLMCFLAEFSYLTLKLLGGGGWL